VLREGETVTEPDAGSLADAGEFRLIAAIARRLPSGPGVLVGSGDDAAVVRAPDGRVVVTTDVLVDGVHFRSDWCSAHDIGRRSAAASLADVAAMGARATALVVALTAPDDTEAAWVLRLADGLRDEAAECGASVVGGDLARSDRLSVAVTALGDLEGREPVTRSGARPGDVVAVAGRLGWAAAGLAVLSRGFASPRSVVQAYRVPEPPYAAGVAAAQAGATALCDVSDGLVADLGHIADASQVSMDLGAASLDVAPPVAAVAAAYGKQALGWVLTGGDDHALVATFPPDVDLPSGFTVIGAVVEPDGNGPTVTVDGQVWPDPAGHEHFRR
jgi:thiamine-monophosphate kinase